MDAVLALFSKIHEFQFHLFEREWILISIICIGLILEIVSRQIKKRFKKSIFAQYRESDDPRHAEYYLEYYRKTQIIDFIRALSFVTILSIVLISKAGLNINFFAIAAGALIVTFKDFILSIIAFFYTVRGYNIGDTIGIGEVQGQIIFIRTFAIGLLGKDNDGDSTGKLYLIPNSRFITDIIRKEDLHTSSIRKEILRIPFRQDEFEMSFSLFQSELRLFLDTMLPVITQKKSGNYQTYIGHRYKIDIDYLEDKCVLISIGIVGKWSDAVGHKAEIVDWVESKRKSKPKKHGE